jgi:hypothetical protein
MILRAVLPAFVLMCSPACAEDGAAARVASAKAAGCRGDVALQQSAKMAGETLSERIERLRQMEVTCPPEIYGDAMQADHEAAIEWLKIVATRSEAEKN